MAAANNSPTAPTGPGAWLGRAAWVLFAVAVLWLAATTAYDYALGVFEHQEDLRRPHYGMWSAAAFSVAFFSLFVLAFLRSPRRREWRHLGLAEAYLVALFVEMYGLPLTVYLLGSVLGANFGFNMLEGHLWAVLLDRLGLLPLVHGVALVMAVSAFMIVVGLALMAAGWWQTWRAKGELVTTRLYRFVRHPQYLGFLLLITGYLIQWPTLPTLVLFPILIVAYARLARREEREVEQRFGERWAAYRARTPMLVPGWPRRASEAASSGAERTAVAQRVERGAEAYHEL